MLDVNNGKCGSLAGHLVISPCDYEIEHEWQSWTGSPERASVPICSARPLRLSHCHCQLPHWGWLERPLVLLQISLSPAKTRFPNRLVIPISNLPPSSRDPHAHLSTWSKLPCHLSSMPLSALSLLPSWLFEPLVCLFFPCLLPIPATKHDLKDSKSHFWYNL